MRSRRAASSAECRPGAARWARGAAAVLVLATLTAVLPLRAALAGASAELAEDPEFQRAMIFIEGANHRGALEALQGLLVRKAGRLHLLASDPSTPPEALGSARADVAEVHRWLAVCRLALGEREKAFAQLSEILSLDPDASLDPLTTPRPLQALMDEAKASKAAGKHSLFELPDPVTAGLLHLPPLVAVSGQEIMIYAKPAAVPPPEEVHLCYCLARRCEEPFRVSLVEKPSGVWIGKIPGANTVQARELYYFLETVDARRHQQVSPWYPVALGPNLNELSREAGERFGPAAVAEIRRREVVVRLSPPARLPEGAREVDSSSGNLYRYRSPY